MRPLIDRFNKALAPSITDTVRRCGVLDIPVTSLVVHGLNCVLILCPPKGDISFKVLVLVREIVLRGLDVDILLDWRGELCSLVNVASDFTFRNGNRLAVLLLRLRLPRLRIPVGVPTVPVGVEVIAEDVTGE